MMQDAVAAKMMPPDRHVRVLFRAELLCDEIVRGGLPGGASGVVEAVGAGLTNRYRPGQRVTVALPTSGSDGDTVPAQRVAPVPDDVNDEEAAFGALAAVVLEAVHRRDVRLGDKAGKPVIIIGALANSEQAHDDIVRARRSSAGFLSGGHPARFAPSCRLLREHISAASVPVNALIRLVDDRSAEPSTIDLARFFIGMPVASVRAVRVTAPSGREGGGSVTLDFTDGSVVSIVRSPGKTVSCLIEIFGVGLEARLENFGPVHLVRDGRTVASDPDAAPEDGLSAMLAAFVSAARAGGPAPVEESELLEANNVAIATEEAARTGGTVRL